MRKVVFVVLILLISVGSIEKLSARSLQSTEKTFEVSKHHGLDEAVPFLINDGKCPNSKNLEPVSSDKGLINALNTIIPEVYKNQNYKGWKVESITHLPKSSHSDAYYAMAKNYCGEEIANNSWFVEVLFPQYLPAYDASHRQIFVTKNKQGQWFAWFRFH